MEIEILRSAGVRGGKPPAISVKQVPWVTLMPDEWMALFRTSNTTSTPASTASRIKETRGSTPLRDLARRSESSSTGSQEQQTRPPGPAGLIHRKRKTKNRAANQDLEGSTVIYKASLSQEELNQFRPSSTLAFAARGLTRGFRGRPIEGDLSNIASATLLDVSPAVEGVSAAQPTEHAIELRWLAPARSLSGGPISGLSGYRVYKSSTGRSGPFESVGETTGIHYQDHDFQFDHTYYYRVRAVFREGRQMAESEDSALLQFTPRDIFPPAAPSSLTAIYTNGVVELIWAANSETDLSGYNVYRRAESGPPQRINAALLGTPAFRDISAEPGRAYYYWVTAVDQAHNESSSSQSVRVETR